MIDAALIATGVISAFVLRTDGGTGGTVLAVAFYGPLVVLPLLWVFVLWVRGVYEARIITLGSEEFRRIVSASVWLFASVAAVSYLFKAEFSRFIVFFALPLGTVLILLNHRVGRSWLHRQRKAGRYVEKVLILAGPKSASEIDSILQSAYQAGLLPVGSFAPPTSAQSARGAPYFRRLYAKVIRTSATALLIAPAKAIDSDFVKRLSWDPTLAGLDLYLAPQLTDVTGPRTLLQGVPDLPFIHLESPELSEWARFSKRVFDLGFSGVGLIIFSPIMVLITFGVWVSSKGAPVFTQTRIGEGGRPFKILKFRTMCQGADEKRVSLRVKTKQHVGTFKMINDPRVTPFGRFLRRWSLDELPQLFNVLIGPMSVVGPRPHPIDDVERYGQGDEIRLRIKPGLTGLQQVSGRSELSWEESVRADLRYIENWSFSGDLLLILRTFRVVATGQGAY